MGVLMMRVRVMCMAVGARQMAMPMRVLARGWILLGRIMVVYMVDIVRAMLMLVTVVQQRVVMPVRMALHQMQDYPKNHQGAGRCPLDGNGLSQKRDREQGAKERRNREIRARACRAQVAQSDYKQCEAGTVTREAECAGCQYNGPCRK